MNKRKNTKDRHVGTGVSLPLSMWDEIDEYCLHKCGGQDRSKLIHELIRAVLDEWKKEKEIEQSIQLTGKDTFRSPIGTTMLSLETQVSNTSNDINEKRNNKPEPNLLEQMYFNPLDEIVKNNLDDIEYIRKLSIMFRKRADFIEKHVRDADSPPKIIKKRQELQEALKRDQEYREKFSELSESNK